MAVLLTVCVVFYILVSAAMFFVGLSQYLFSKNREPYKARRRAFFKMLFLWPIAILSDNGRCQLSHCFKGDAKW